MATRKRVTTVSAATRRGDRLGELLAMRKRLAKVIDDDSTSPRDLAALTRRLMEISREIEAEETQESELAEVASIGDANTTWRPEAI
ncbi:hypothetical protein [Brevibacterium paucivorans]|uniref:hypothetical protein n=1 Tax=Brevibacterium paucivorans TaxID=170994 RepID=UPI00321C382D